MATVTLTWTPNDAEQLVSKYTVYSNKVGNPPAFAGETTSNSIVLPNLTAGVYEFAVSATNLAGEGPKSALVTSPSLPSAPADVVIMVN